VREVDPDVERFLAGLTPAMRQRLFVRLRMEFPIHQLEREWNTTAEQILEAISRGSDLTRRGVRGLLAEAAFFAEVVPAMARHGWHDATPGGDIAYDAALCQDDVVVRVQVKLQRRLEGRAMVGSDAPRKLGFSADFYVAETQKTRSGKRKGIHTRPYRFGEFDILAVSLAPATGTWDPSSTRWQAG
jgi:hypothetical protein